MTTGRALYERERQHTDFDDRWDSLTPEERAMWESAARIYDGAAEIHVVTLVTPEPPPVPNEKPAVLAHREMVFDTYRADSEHTKAAISAWGRDIERQMRERGVLDKLPETVHLEQPPPVPNEKPAVWDLVLTDMQARDAEGRRKYGTPLQPHNGRDALVDAYQEALDLAVYLRQAIYERDGR